MLLHKTHSELALASWRNRSRRIVRKNTSNNYPPSSASTLARRFEYLSSERCVAVDRAGMPYYYSAGLFHLYYLMLAHCSRKSLSWHYSLLSDTAGGLRLQRALTVLDFTIHLLDAHDTVRKNPKISLHRIDGACSRSLLKL